MSANTDQQRVVADLLAQAREVYEDVTWPALPERTWMHYKPRVINLWWNGDRYDHLPPDTANTLERLCDWLVGQHEIMKQGVDAADWVRRHGVSAGTSDQLSPRGDVMSHDPQNPTADADVYDDDNEYDIDEEDEFDCGAWFNGKFDFYSCQLAGTEDCDWECPYSARARGLSK